DVCSSDLLILLLLTGGVLVFETTRLPTLDVSPKIATFGEHVVVTATRVPRDQTGEIRLESVLHTFPFRADKAGKVSAELAVPNDIATGDHILRICWDGQCRAETTLRVVAGVAAVSPLPGASPTSSPSSSPSHRREDRKSTRLNSSHVSISYAVFCLKKKTNTRPQHSQNLLPHSPHVTT